MKTFSAFVVEAKDPNEYDKEGEMAENQLRTIIDAAEDLIDLLEDDDNLPEWAQNKITKAVDYLDSVRDYMVSDAEGEEDDDEEEDDLEESVEEALSPSYQNKYIGMPDADLRRKRNSFLDQINDLVKFKKKSRRDPEVVDLQDKIRKIDYAMSHKKESVEEVESITELTAEEKRLINTMYDKKGNLTDIGKKVMDHGKKNRFPHNTSASQGKMMSGKSTMYSEDTQIDEAKLSQQQRDRLDDLIFNVMITGNIEYDGKDNPTRHLKTIEKEFGPKVAKQVEAGMDIKNWGRDNHSSGFLDSLAYRKKSRISASGKMNKQDAVALGKRIMQDKSFGGLTKKVKLPEDTQIDEAFSAEFDK